jgi:NADH:ubiquinone oxidoreductase subunit 5 (subunit L)/multisubunit Na+/H+ antiporter MnhA subunit
MDNKLIIDTLKENIARRAETDRIMWFSMWFLAAVATFGLAFFPMFYLLIERRNKHFARQKELEDLVVVHLKDRGVDLKLEKNNSAERNSLVWALSIVLISPIFIIAYLLSKDLVLHEEKQRMLFGSLLQEKNFEVPSINIKRCVLLTVITLGLGIVYWLYKIFNSYNRHFKEQWITEDKIFELLVKGENRDEREN